MLITLLTVDGLTSVPNAGALVTENTTVWVGVIAALGGALVTGLLNLVGATIGERGRERAARFEEHQADKTVMRQAFAAYLDAAIRLHNALSVEAGKLRGTDAAVSTVLEKPDARAAFDAFNERACTVPFLVDSEGVAALDSFEGNLLTSAVGEGLGQVAPVPWSRQTAEVLAAMRRALHLED